MKVVGFKYFYRNKKQKKIKIFCVGRIFKPLVIAMSVVLGMLVLNLISNNFFAYIHASLQNFVDSFVSVL